MTARLISRGCLVVLIGVGCAGPATLLRAQGPDLGTDAQRASGKQLYARYCAQCHGEKGDGEGYATPHLSPRPRNFTTGKFKVRTTPNGALPTHQDLVNIIRRGMPYTSMPAWPNLSDQQVSELAYFIKTFSPDFADSGKVPKPVETAERAERLERDRRAGEEAVRRDGLFAMPRDARAGRRPVGAHAEGRLSGIPFARPISPRAGPSAAGRHARTSSGR